MVFMNPDSVDFPHVQINETDVIQPTRPVNVYRRGVQRRTKKKEKEESDLSRRQKAKNKSLDNMDVDIDVSLEVYDDHEHKHTICTEHHQIDRRV